MNADMAASEDVLELSFVFPCLNEESTLAACIRAVRASLEAKPGFRYEIIVADNGSTDKSREEALREGARVVHVSERGYGAALRGGIRAARGRFVAFADADGTYPYEDSLRLYQAASDNGADLAIASRLAGAIEPGAMPLLHRRLGTPVLTALINLLFKGSLSDCNSGFRCFRKEAFDSWKLRSDGMEFASEMLIKALKHGSVTVEICSGLRPDKRGRVPHLRTWRDGMRHLLFILSEKPQLFERTGLALAAIASLLQLIGMFTGQLDLGFAAIFGIHSQVLLLLFGMLGVQLYLFGVMCYVNADDQPSGLSSRIIHLDEGRLFFLLVALLLLVGLVSGGAVLLWGLAGFRDIHFAHILVGLVHLLGVPVSLALGMLGVHVIKRYR